MRPPVELPSGKKRICPMPSLSSSERAVWKVSSMPRSICTGARMLAGAEQPLLDVEREQLLAVLEERRAARLAQAVGDRAGCHLDVEIGLAAQHEAGDEGQDQADDAEHDQQLEQGEAPLVQAASPAGDVLILALAALGLVGAERIQVVVAVLAREAVDVQLVPRGRAGRRAA